MPGYRYPFQRYEPILTKSRLVEEYLLSLATTFGRLFDDRQFMAVLRAEGVEDVPEQLAIRVEEAKTPVAFVSKKPDSLRHRVRVAEESYGKQVVTLSISCAYVARLLKLETIEQYLIRSHPDILGTLRTLLSDVKGQSVQTINPIPRQGVR